MDYSKFTDENFDVKEWVNAAFAAHKDGPKDQYATTLVMKLQMFIQEVNNVVEESCQQAVNNLPRVVRELEAVKQESLLLQEQMRSVKYDIQKVEQDTSQSMQTLLRLDEVKGRMMDASAALQEADNWTTLSADVDEVFDSGDVTAISEKLVGMQQSLQVLTDVPDYTERCQFLETLKNRLEATLSPQVVSAFSSQNLEMAQNYVKIFMDIDRLPQLHKYYHKCHKGEFLHQWRSILDESEGPLPSWLSELLDHLLTVWHQQVKWCGQVFPEPVPIVCDLMAETLQGLDPSLPASITSYLATAPNKLSALIELKKTSERFAKSIESATESSLSDNLHCMELEKLAKAIYGPYVPYIETYGELEKELLAKALLHIPLDHEEVSDTVGLLGDSVAKLFSEANEANERCVELSNGCGYNGLIKAVQEYLSDYLKEFRRVLTNLREKCNVDTNIVDSDDWPLFQNSLSVIQTCGDLLLHTDELDGELVANIVASVAKYCPPTPSHDAPASPTKHESRRNVFHDFHHLLLSDAGERKALESLITQLEEGDSPSVLDSVKQEMCQLSELVHQFAFDIVFAPLRQQLSHLPNMEMWTSASAGGAYTSDLPTFSLTPQEYITKVGQYLLTVPQQLEPYVLEDNPTLATALKYGRLPYTADQTELPEHLADLWLESIAKGTMHTYCEQVLKIQELSPHATKQLLTDIDYLCNVLDDLGLQPSENLSHLTELLKASADDYLDVMEDKPQRLISAVANMRNIPIH